MWWNSIDGTHRSNCILFEVMQRAYEYCVRVLASDANPVERGDALRHCKQAIGLVRYLTGKVMFRWRDPPDYSAMGFRRAKLDQLAEMLRAFAMWHTARIQELQEMTNDEAAKVLLAAHKIVTDVMRSGLRVPVKRQSDGEVLVELFVPTPLSRNGARPGAEEDDFYGPDDAGPDPQMRDRSERTDVGDVSTRTVAREQPRVLIVLRACVVQEGSWMKMCGVYAMVLLARHYKYEMVDYGAAAGLYNACMRTLEDPEDRALFGREAETANNDATSNTQRPTPDVSGMLRVDRKYENACTGGTPPLAEGDTGQVSVARHSSSGSISRRTGTGILRSPARHHPALALAPPPAPVAVSDLGRAVARTVSFQKGV